MTAVARPSMLPLDRDWPPHARAAEVASGAIEICGRLEHDAELRMQADGARGVILLQLCTGLGFPYVAKLPVAGDHRSLQDATALTRALRRGTEARVRAHGCQPRTDHDKAVLQLLDVTSVAPITEEA